MTPPAGRRAPGNGLQTSTFASASRGSDAGADSDRWLFRAVLTCASNDRYARLSLTTHSRAPNRINALPSPNRTESFRPPKFFCSAGLLDL